MPRSSFVSAVAFVYGLAEPDTGRIRYVGRSIDPWRRIDEHVSAAATDPIHGWVAELRDRGLSPLLVILAPIGPSDSPDALEQQFIWSLRTAELLNIVHLPIHASAAPEHPTRPAPDTLPGRLAFARRMGGITANRLSELAGLGRSHVALIERGAKARIRAGTVVSLTRVLGVSIDWLAVGVGVCPKRSQVRAAIDMAARLGCSQGAA